MVLLLPLLEGERPKTCRCGATGLCSEVRERTTFYSNGRLRSGRRRWMAECRACSVERSTAWQRRNGNGDKERRRARRRERKRDPAYRARQREYRRRYVQRLRLLDPAEYERQRARKQEMSRMNRRLRRERKEGMVLEIAEPRKSSSSGIRLPVKPFRSWVEGLLAEERRRDGDEKGAWMRVAAAIDVTPRTLYRYLHEFRDVDESVVDRAVSRDGRISLWELYPSQLDYEPAQGEFPFGAAA